MKKYTNLKTVLAGKILLCFVALGAVLGGEAGWMIAGLLGWAALTLALRRKEPKLAPVKVRSPKTRF